MAIKFSQFVVQTNASALSHIVGYNGADNIQITPTDFINSLVPGGPFLPLAGGTMTGDLIFGDGVVAKFGNGQDLRIQSLNDDGYIQSYSGDLYITQQADDKDIIFSSDDGAGGIATYFFLDGSAGGSSPFTVFPDNSHLTFGTGYDLRQYHNGSDSYLDNYTGNLNIRNYADDKDIIFQSDNGSGGVATYFYLDGGNNFTNFQLNARWVDNAKAQFGNSGDMEIYHDTSHSYIKSGGTGDLYIQQFRDDGDIIFQSDDGSGGVTTYLKVDALSQAVTFVKPAYFTDNVKALFGNSSDLEIYHDGNNSYIKDAGTGNLNILGETNIFIGASTGGANMAQFIKGGAVKLRYNDSNKFETTNTGVGITGQAVVSNGIDINGGNVDLIDNVRLRLGTASDLQIYHDGSNSYIDDAGTGSLLIKTSALLVRNPSDASMLDAQSGGAINLYYSGSKKFETTSTGVTVTGDGTFTGDVIANTHFNSSDSNATLSTTGAGNVFLRPNGKSVTTGQMKLDSSGNATFAGDVKIAEATNKGQLFFGTADTNYEIKGGGNYGYLSLNAPILRFDTGGTERMRIDTSGNAIFAGNVTIPEYIYHSGDGDTYFQFPAANEFKLVAGGNNIIAGDANAAYLYYQGGVKLQTTSTGISVTGVSEFADNTAAIAGGLTTGDVYRTGDLLKIVH